MVLFHSGLNVILGDANATNSVGKSTMLMVVDFAFGGKDLLLHNDDVVKELGHHEYLFTFQFADEVYRFAATLASRIRFTLAELILSLVLH